MIADDILGKVKLAAEPALKQSLSVLQARFMDSFGNIGSEIHKDQIGSLLREAGQAKLDVLMAKSDEDRKINERVYELKIMAIETYVLGAKIVADAKAASLIREAAAQLLDVLGTVALAVIKSAAEALVAGAVGGVTGGPAGAIVSGAAGAVSAFLKKPGAK